jgi:hypothetical protein
MTQIFIKIGANEYKADNYSIPSDRVFRDAWVANTEEAVISVDMTKAKTIWRNKIRAARISEFSKLDAEFMKALETNSDVTAIVAQKQALRDAPAHPDIDLAQTPEQLKVVQPAGLNIE